MTGKKTPTSRGHYLHSTGFVWGRQRVELGISVRQLARLSGVNTGELSRFENGRMIPTAEQYDKVTQALERVAKGSASTEGTAGALADPTI